jgi:hypothetical protein
MKLAIIGSRTITRLNLDDYIKEKPDCVISGGAKGIDTLAACCTYRFLWLFSLKQAIKTTIMRLLWQFAR